MKRRTKEKKKGGGGIYKLILYNLFHIIDHSCDINSKYESSIFKNSNLSEISTQLIMSRLELHIKSLLPCNISIFFFKHITVSPLLPTPPKKIQK